VPGGRRAVAISRSHASKTEAWSFVSNGAARFRQRPFWPTGDPIRQDWDGQSRHRHGKPAGLGATSCIARLGYARWATDPDLPSRPERLIVGWVWLRCRSYLAGAFRIYPRCRAVLFGPRTRSWTRLA
jgi:hypothetical protein